MSSVIMISNIICTVMTIYISVLYTDSVIICMCHCMLLAIPGMSPYWMIVYIYVSWVYYKHVWILPHYLSIYVSMYGMSLSLHSFPYNMKRFLFGSIFDK